MKSISARLERLEHRPQSQIPRFLATFEDGHTETFWGGEVLRYGKDYGVKRVEYDENHQPAVDQIALYSLLHEDVEIVPKTNQ